ELSGCLSGLAGKVAVRRWHHCFVHVNHQAPQCGISTTAAPHDSPGGQETLVFMGHYMRYAAFDIPMIVISRSCMTSFRGRMYLPPLAAVTPPAASVTSSPPVETRLATGDRA